MFYNVYVGHYLWHVYDDLSGTRPHFFGDVIFWYGSFRGCDIDQKTARLYMKWPIRFARKNCQVCIDVFTIINYAEIFYHVRSHLHVVYFFDNKVRDLLRFKIRVLFRLWNLWVLIKRQDTIRDTHDIFGLDE